MDTKVCPICHTQKPVCPPEVSDRHFQAINLFYSLGSGLVWSLHPHIVGFSNLDHAKAFKAQYPEFKVEYIQPASFDIIQNDGKMESYLR